MTLAWPWMLLLLPLPWLARRWLPPVRGAALRVPSVAEFGEPDDGRRRDATSGLPPRIEVRARIAASAWLLLVLAAARPLGPPDPQQLPVSGRELMIAVDVSASMATRDLRLDGRPVERLEAARELARGFLAGRDGDRVGLIVFGNQAYLHTPLTFDRQAVDAALGETAVGMAGRETALGDAIVLAAKRMREFGDSARVLILLTDGVQTAGETSVKQAAWIAAREGLRVHAVGIGAERMRVATTEGIREIDPSRDLDEATLAAIAEQTGGSYQRATDAEALAAFYRRVDALEPIDHGTAAVWPQPELYPWPLGFALLLAAGLVAQRIRRDVTCC